MDSTASKTGGHLNETKSAIEISDTISSNSRSASGAYNIPAVDLSTARNSTLGLDRYLQEIKLRPATAYINSLVVFIILAAILLVLSFLIGSLLTSKKSNRKDSSGSTTEKEKESAVSHSTRKRMPHLRQSFRDYMGLNALRWFMVAAFPLLTLAFYTFRISGGAGSAFTAIAAIFFVFTLLSMAAVALSVKRVVAKDPDGVDGLFESQRQRRRYGALFHQFKRNRSWFAWLLVAAMFLRAVFVGAAQRSPWAQIIPLILIELVVFLCICIFKPHSSRGSNVLDGFLSAIRLLTVGILIAFIPSLNTNRIAV
jgi:uncharacterized membrane protein YhaH (DUF805 family)